jgi:hypothetical protein
VLLFKNGLFWGPLFPVGVWKAGILMHTLVRGSRRFFWPRVLG